MKKAGFILTIFVAAIGFFEVSLMGLFSGESGKYTLEAIIKAFLSLLALIGGIGGITGKSWLGGGFTISLISVSLLSVLDLFTGGLLYLIVTGVAAGATLVIGKKS